MKNLILILAIMITIFLNSYVSIEMIKSEDYFLKVSGLIFMMLSLFILYIFYTKITNKKKKRIGLITDDYINFEYWVHTFGENGVSYYHIFSKHQISSFPFRLNSLIKIQGYEYTQYQEIIKEFEKYNF